MIHAAVLLIGGTPAGVASRVDVAPVELRTPEIDRRVLRRSTVVPGLAPRLQAQIRETGHDHPLRFVAKGLGRPAIEAAGGVVTAEIGPIVAGRLTGENILILAPFAERIDAPQPLHPLLDESRADIHADEIDRGEGFTGRYRGNGTIIAGYDSGIDLAHPDLRILDGPSRVIALWDQDLVGTPPAGKTEGHLCTRDVLLRDACPTRDLTGHGTHVMSIAASNGPEFRGVAPDASLIMARSSTYPSFIETLDWVRSVGAAEGQPVVFNLSLGGHEGPHDGTSLECQAIDALEHLVVAAAGNDGLLPIHALARLEAGVDGTIALRFPVLPDPTTRRAVVEIWGDVGLPLSAQAAVLAPGGAVLTETPFVTVGETGMSVALATQTATLGIALLDPEPDLNPFNGQPHIRIELMMMTWEDAPTGPGYAAIRVRAQGRVDLWVDTPATEPAPIRFDRDRVLGIDAQVLGDSDHSISDPATAVTAIAVGAYTTRTEFTTSGGATNAVGGSLGDIAGFTSWGPTISPATTGPKPDLAAPGHVIIGARSKDSPEDSATVSKLYRAGAGTSLAAPHVAGTAALLLGAKPSATKEELKGLILGSAARDGRVEDSLDPRWGAGRLDARAAIATIVPLDEGCGCSVRRSGGRLSDTLMLAALMFLRRPARSPTRKRAT